MLKFELSMSKIKENKSFYLIGLCAAISYAAGIFAGSVYNKFGGLAIGLVIALIAFFAEVYFIATAGAVAKTRSKGTLVVSAVLALFYVGLFISCDIAGKTPISAIINSEASIFGIDTQPTKFGTALIVFEMLCLTILLLTIARYTANAFGKEWSFYERLLGTMRARQEHKDDDISELPRKDTDRIVLEAKADVPNIKINDVNPVYPPEKEAESVIPEHKTEVCTEEEINVIPNISEESAIDVAEPIIADSVEDKEDDQEEIGTEESPLNHVIDEEEEELFSATGIDEEPSSQAFARDVRQEFVIHRTTHKEDEDDDLYTDFTYGSDND